MSSCPHIHFECLVCRKNAVLTLRHVPRMSPSSIVFRLLFRLPQPGEEGRDGLEGHTLTMLLGGVFARLPLVESVLRDDVLVIQTVKEHPEKVWKSKETLSSLFLAVIWNCKLTFGFWRLNMKKKWPPVKVILYTDWGQHITGVDSSSTFKLLISRTHNVNFFCACRSSLSEFSAGSQTNKPTDAYRHLLHQSV